MDSSLIIGAIFSFFAGILIGGGHLFGVVFFVVATWFMFLK